MDLWGWVLVPRGLPIYAGSSTSVNVLSDRQQLVVTTLSSKRLPFFQDSCSMAAMDQHSR